jgi:hypothetical protein
MVSHQLTLDLEQGGVLAANNLKVKGTEAKTFQIKELTNTTIFDAYTPYQGARELYELPLGLFATAGGVVINIVDFALLGLLPNNFTNGTLYVGFAGINPFMNIESKSRKELSVASELQKLLDERVERTVTPLTGQSLVVASKDVSHPLELDEKGEASLSLLELFETLPQSRELVFSVENDGVKTEERATLSRRLQSGLFQAKNLLAKYDDAGEALDSLDVSLAARDILALSNLGFERESQQLEDRIAGEMEPAELAQLLAALVEPFLAADIGGGKAVESEAVVKVAKNLLSIADDENDLAEGGTDSVSLPEHAKAEADTETVEDGGGREDI